MYNGAMFFVEIFLLLNFTVLCGILVTLWSMRDQLKRISDGKSEPPK